MSFLPSRLTISFELFHITFELSGRSEAEVAIERFVMFIAQEAPSFWSDTLHRLLSFLRAIVSTL